MKNLEDKIKELEFKTKLHNHKETEEVINRLYKEIIFECSNDKEVEDVDGKILVDLGAKENQIRLAKSMMHRNRMLGYIIDLIGKDVYYLDKLSALGNISDEEAWEYIRVAMEEEC